MSTPTIVVNPSNVPTSFQIATPFSFSFSNSGSYSPPPVVHVPTYTKPLTPWTVVSTGSYSPENVLVSNASPSTGIDSLNGKIGYVQSNISNGSLFSFQLPYPTNGLGNSGVIQFMPEAQFTLSNAGGTSWGVEFACNAIFNHYDAGDYVQHEWVAASNAFNVTIVRAKDGNISCGMVTPSAVRFFLSNITWASTTDPVSFTITSPDSITPQPSTIPYINVSSLTSHELLPFLSGSGTTQVQFASTTGFQSIPSSNLTLWIDQVYNGSNLHSNVTSNIVVNPISITVTPTLTNPLTISTYYPFSYTFSIPSNVVNVVLSSNSNTTTPLSLIHI